MTYNDAMQRAYAADNMTRIHHDIETMTRRLELEKRRLQRIEKELSAARRTYQVRIQRRPVERKALEAKSDDTSLPKADKRSSSRPSTARASTAQRSSRYTRNQGSRLEDSTTSDLQPYDSNQAKKEADGDAEEGIPEVNISMRILLNRLDVQRKKLDYVNHDNATLRQEVDTLRRRRLQLNGIFDRLKQEIKLRSTQLQDFLEETGASQTVQNDAQQRVGVMRRHRDLERKQFKHEVLRLREQLRLHDWERKELEVQLKRAETGVQKKKELIVPEEESGFSEGAMMRRIMKTAFLNCIQRRHIKQHQKNIEVFEQAFATIKQSTGIEHIEEIVKIFVQLETKNFSLLTYVNHMNREIEALEGNRRERRAIEKAREKQEEANEQARQQALADIQRQLQASQFAIHESHESCAQHRDLLDSLRPLLLETAQRIHRELELLQGSGPWQGNDILRLPSEIREETVPEWLEWVETALGRFRDLLPGAPHEKESAFPCTAVSQVKQLPPKRLGGHAPPQQLVKPQELPSAFTLLNDGMEGNSQKRGGPHGQLTQSQKAEMLDDEQEEEDFGDRPLMLKDLRSRAEQSALKRKRRGNKRDGLMGTTLNEMPPGMRRLAETTSGRPGRSSEFKGIPQHSNTYESGGTATRSSIARTGEVLREQDEDNPEGSTRLTSDGSFDGKDRQQSMEQTPTVKEEAAIGRGSIDPGNAAGPGQRRPLKRSEVTDDQVPDVTDEELNNAFLKRYKMTKDELQAMSERLNIHPSNLCFLKQEFDLYDEDQSGYIDARELKGLLKRLGEDVSDDNLDQAFRDLDSDGSGEIEFFEFVEWFTSTD
mmetsp:Transcript_49074/g.88733  ORF Transcript_49074/g.88733 Transcript_49074/m.88733 type:complete len:827 (+) Transcript_49074:152-2632(+)